jgi:ABC-type glycerol-3-phosphate transport system substrate-binding protein
MSRLSKLRVVALLAAGAVAVGGLAACSKSDGENSTDGGNVKIVWWHNITSDPGKTVMQDAANRFMEANPNVTIEIVPVQNEDLQNKLHTALNGPDAPDMFQQWGGGAMKDQVDQGLLMDVSDVAADVIAKIPGSVTPWQTDGKTYGLPYTAGVAGVYYSQDLFEKAGITAAPTTWEEFLADITALKDAGIVPIGLGGKDAWPVGHWMYAFILASCGKDVIAADTTDKKFDDPCYAQAAQNLVDLGATEPFEDGWISVSAQQGAGSSSGMLANHQVAMEFSGVWETSQVASLTPDTKPLADLHWFALPPIPGGKAGAGERVGGGDGFSCLKTAPKECGEFLTYLVGDESQKEYAQSGTGIPVNPSALQYITTPSLQEAATGSQQISYLQLWLDQAFGDTVGQAINQNSVGLLSGDLDPDQFVQSLKDAALKG